MCGVMRTVIPSPSDLIWDKSATSFSSGEGLRRGEGNSSKACLGMDMPLFLPNWIISDSVFTISCNKRQCFAKLRRNQTLHLVTVLPGTVDFFYVFNSETIPRLLAVSFGLSYVNMTCT